MPYAQVYAPVADLRGVYSGGKLVFQYTRKRPSPRICGATGVRLNGVRLLLLHTGRS